ncbi:transmembrane protein, putative (macronuclear) [Tetrahymena thermophila SB210]|uniref:Transmembrane protein, putative n=1 Tax=Tetrahymena thermophila (strain SB210) TaxID=312017 RepID=I7LX49_TETTS|nr:transmembrane protein, putative [Tetrahymena thermophila SB210]EAS03762.2 transmembrane protein, putative [Tetrahymena thermophila SB210]|eukprot:XP_001024007.2 transmembrane protein, putative [Tetrahymena thermophila SB210]
MSFFKKLDIFGTPFVFEMGTGNEKMKTTLGGLLSFAVIIIAMVYFGYLNYMYGSGNLQPKISSQQKRITKDLIFPIAKNLIWFDIQNSDDESYLIYQQQQQNFQLISYTVSLQQTDSNGQLIQPNIHIPTNFCSTLTDDPEVDGEAQCLDFSGLPSEEVEFKVYAGKGYDTKIFIELNAICTGDVITCLSSSDFQQYVFGDTQTFQLNIKGKQFNSDNDNLETKVETLSWDLDQTLLTTSRITLQTSQTSIQSGFIVQQPQKYLHLSDANSNDSYKTRANSSNQNLIAKFVISVDSIQYVQSVQNVQYPEILAQFGSILNVLLLLSILGAIIAKADIQQYFIDLKLKEYYKLTALKILKQQSENENQKGSQLKETSASQSKLTKDDILRSIKELEENDFNKELKKKFNVSFFERVVRSLLGEQKEDYMKKKRGNKDLYEALFFQASQSQDVFELQTELLRIKKILAIALTPQQYAAIKCCGSSLSDQIPFLLERSNQNDIKKTQIKPEKEQLENLEIESQTELLMQKQYTHIELIDKIDYDDQYFQLQLEKFLQDAEKGFYNQDEHEKKMNQRLIDCLKKTYGFNN